MSDPVTEEPQVDPAKQRAQELCEQMRTALRNGDVQPALGILDRIEELIG